MKINDQSVSSGRLPSHFPSDRAIVVPSNPDAAVEAAAKALHAAECGWNDWQMIHPGRGSYIKHARVALEAAAPHLMAQALEDAAGFVTASVKAGADDDISPQETIDWLLARAATYGTAT